MIYRDDISVFSKDPESHIDHFDDILTLLREAAVMPKLKKRFFFQKEVENL